MKNELNKASSSYLLQHANNPVYWQMWSNSLWQKAQEQNKLVLVSIGYAACHWCHVMEHECFENQELANIMNDNFICIKVDREEFPDVDNYYMQALQLMTGKGGWPLNCFCLPNKTPIFGGTYFNAKQWKGVLHNLIDVFTNDTNHVNEYALKLEEGITIASLLEKSNKENKIDNNFFTNNYISYAAYFDKIDGGNTYAPKFPMPVNYNYLLHFDTCFKTNSDTAYLNTTLHKMALGGIYDHLAGAWCRYSVDGFWKVPHFEKMLYDNGQLISLYSKAYAYTKIDLYKEVAIKTIGFLNNTLLNKTQNAYYSSMDADSEGVEGKYYVWTLDELSANFKESDVVFIQQVYGVNTHAYWEHGNSVLMKKDSNNKLALLLKLSLEEFTNKLDNIDKALLSIRNKRIAPAFDTKEILSWNALAVIGLIDAAKYLKQDSFKQQAENIIAHLLQNFYVESNWYRINTLQTKIIACLDDLANLVQALLEMYLYTQKEQYAIHANNIVQYAIANYFDTKTGMFFYSHNNFSNVQALHETQDNVIPSSNAVMAHNLYLLSFLMENTSYVSLVDVMLANVNILLQDNNSSYAHWYLLLLKKQKGLTQFVCNHVDIITALENKIQFNPFTIVLSCNKNSTLPILLNKYHYPIFVCKDYTCLAPINTIEEALLHC